MKYLGKKKIFKSLPLLLLYLNRAVSRHISPSLPFFLTVDYLLINERTGWRGKKKVLLCWERGGGGEQKAKQWKHSVKAAKEEEKTEKRPVYAKQG